MARTIRARLVDILEASRGIQDTVGGIDIDTDLPALEDAARGIMKLAEERGL